MSSELGVWLRRQREDRGWTRSEMARQIIRAAKAKGDASVPSADNIGHNIYRWERGVVRPAERYQLHYCTAFGIPFSQFGPVTRPLTEALTDAVTQPVAQPVARSMTQPGPADPPGMVDPSPGAPGLGAYRETQPPDVGASAIRRGVLMAAHEGSEHAERVEQRGIGEATLEQFRADVAQLSLQYMTGEPFVLFMEMRRVRNRIAEALDRRQWPRDAAELYLLAGALSALMAAAATNLGYPQAAEELTRSGWAYATIIDHRPLMGRLRLCAAYAAYWGGQPGQAASLAGSGLEYVADGQNAAQLHLYAGLARARLGDAPGARQAIAAARDARERDHRDELLEIGGEFGFSRATHSYYAGSVLVETARTEGAPSDAARSEAARTGAASNDVQHDEASGREASTELESATGLYRAGPEPGEHHSRKCQMLAHTDLAIARLREGALDAAIAALQPVLALPAGERTAVQARRLDVLRAELGHPIFRGSAPARELAEQVAEFSRGDFGSLPGQDGVEHA